MSAPATSSLAAAGLPDLTPIVQAAQQHDLLFATVSGAHLYGFPSSDSDVDLRGVHLLPLRDVLGVDAVEETHDSTWEHEGVEMDLVTHDLAKFARLLLRPNGYVLEQLLSPLVAHTTPTHEALIDLAPHLLTRHHARHYRGFAKTQWRRFERTGEIKALLYTLRVLLSGIHLMRAHEVLPHLPSLAEAQTADAPAYLPSLIRAKASAEHGLLSTYPDAPPLPRLAADVEALHATLDAAEATTRLPSEPSAGTELNNLLVTMRLRTA